MNGKVGLGEGHTPRNARFTGVSAGPSIETGVCFRCWEYWSVGVRVRKGFVRSLGRGNEQDARFTILRDSRTPRSESNRSAGDKLQKRF